MPDIKTVADKADVIINGYAFTRESDRIHVLNLNSPNKAVVFSTDGEVLETTMDDISMTRTCPLSCHALVVTDLRHRTYKKEMIMVADETFEIK